MTAITSAIPDALSGKSTRLVIPGSGVRVHLKQQTFSMIIGARHFTMYCSVAPHIWLM